MKTVLSRMMEEFRTWDLPSLTDRPLYFPEVHGKATVITGMRRTGKTSFAYQKMNQLLKDGIARDRILYLNFDDDRLVRFKLEDCQTILDVYYGEFPDNRDQLCYFFFDEIQRVKGWESFIRRLIDREKVQIVLTGSSSTLLSKEIATTMRGRAIRSVIYPFSFEEFLIHHKIFDTLPERLSDRDISKLRNALTHYFTIGGFPEVQDVDARALHLILQEYIDLVMFNDVVERHKVSNVQVLRFLLDAVFNNPAQKFSVNNFYTEMREQLKLKCAQSDLYDFLGFFEDAYIFFRVYIHSKSTKKRQVNPSKIYLIDVGLDRVAATDPDANKGHLLENMVCLQLLREGWQLEYYVTKRGGKEVDFYAYHPEAKAKKLIQVSYDIASKDTFEREMDALVIAGNETGITDRVIVTWDDEKTLDNGVKIVPAWLFLLGR